MKKLNVKGKIMKESRGESLPDTAVQRFLRAQKAVIIRKSYLKLVVTETITEKMQEA